MFYLKMAKLEVPLKKFTRIDKRYAINEMCSITNKKTYLSVLPIAICKSRQEAEEKLRMVSNTISEFERKTGTVYEVNEYYITDDSDKIEDDDVAKDYTIVMGGVTYSATDVRKMIQILEHLNCYKSLASVIAHVRYGFLKKKIGINGEPFIYYKDERQEVYFNENNEIVHKYLYGKKKENSNE